MTDAKKNSRELKRRWKKIAEKHCDAMHRQLYMTAGQYQILMYSAYHDWLESKDK